MTINGMTDKKIIKALECCQTSYDKRCEECPYQNYKFICNNKMKKDALDLINHQKAEIERSKTDNLSMQKTLSKMSLGVEQARVEAFKEFAEILIEKANENFLNLRGLSVHYCDIVEVLKEKTGGAK